MAPPNARAMYVDISDGARGSGCVVWCGVVCCVLKILQVATVDLYGVYALSPRRVGRLLHERVRYVSIICNCFPLPPACLPAHSMSRHVEYVCTHPVNSCRLPLPQTRYEHVSTTRFRPGAYRHASGHLPIYLTTYPVLYLHVYALRRCERARSDPVRLLAHARG